LTKKQRYTALGLRKADEQEVNIKLLGSLDFFELG
jgi:hypothetical protein